MPVDFQIKNKKVSAVGALAMVMHASEMPRGNFWQVKIGEAALETLGPMDYCGVVDWNHMGNGAGVRWIWNMPSGVDRVFGNKKKMMQLIRRMQPGDMPDFQPAVRLMFNGLMKTKASMRHAILISDGDPSPPTAALLKQYKDNNIKISTVGVGTHGPAMRKELQAIAENKPRRWILSDKTLRSLAIEQPENLDTFQQTEDVNKDHIGYADALLNEIKQAQNLPQSDWPEANSTGPLSNEQRKLVKQGQAFIRQRAEELNVSPSLLATRSVVEKIIRGKRELDLLNSWKKDLVGDALIELIESSEFA